MATLVQDHLQRDPSSGRCFMFRGSPERLIKVLCWNSHGLCLVSASLERGSRAVSPSLAAALAVAQLTMLLEGIDWRAPERTNQPLIAGSEDNTEIAASHVTS